MPYQNILYKEMERVGWITLHRPEVGNAINSLMAEELREICQKVSQEEDVLVVVITGAGEAFSVGEDWGELPESLEQEGYSAEEKQLVWRSGAARAIAGINCPVIAAINGDALGHGLELALAADLRIASESAHFGFPQALDGLLPRDGGTQRLPRIVGKGKALEMFLTAQVIDAAEAYRIGLVHRVVSEKDIASEAEKLARNIASRAPLSLKYAKEAVHQGLDLTLEQGLRLEGDLYLILQTTEDRTEGIRAFREKRTPRFKGQ